MKLNQRQMDGINSYKSAFAADDFQSILDELNELQWIEDVNAILYFLIYEAKINIGENVTKLPEALFFECNSIKDISIPINPYVTEIPIQFASGCGIEKIDIPENVEIIEDCAFYDCKSLQEVTFHEGLQSISRGAFKVCNIDKIVIPKTCNYIGKTAFAHNPLTEVTILSEDITIDDSAFANCTSIGKVKLKQNVFTEYEHLFSPYNPEFKII